MSKRVLIVSPHFPPVNAPDMQRVRVSLPAFVEAGWDVTVLTVDDPTPTAPLEPELATTLPSAVHVVRAHCWSRRWTGRFGFNNVALRSLPFLFWRGCRLLRQQRYDVVYFSTTMFVVLPLGRVWRCWFGVPYVIDLQDPWVSDYYERPGAPRPPGGWKYRFARALGLGLEGWTLRRAAEVIVVSASYADTLRGRYAELRDTPFTELPFGSPDPDLALAAERARTGPALLPRGGFRLGFAGALGPGMFSSVALLFAALAVLRRENIAVSVHFFGTSYSPHGEAQPATLALAAQYGIADLVHEQPTRLRYREALQVTHEADANLLFGSSDLAFTPSKILAVLAVNRPVLALAPTGSALVGRLAHFGETCLTFTGSTPDDAALAATVERLRQLMRGEVARGAPEHLAAFSARSAARRQMEILGRASELA